MTEIKILIEGYAKEIKNGWKASSSVVLVRNNKKNILIDTGCNRKKLIDSLVLMDGDLVEVNADKGIIKIIKK